MVDEQEEQTEQATPREQEPVVEEYAFRWELRRQSEHAIAFELGDMMVHARSGFRGLIVGFDDTCRQTEEWMEAKGVDSLSRGRNQPFYHILVDERDVQSAVKQQIGYVAEEEVVRASPEGEFPSEPLRHRLVASLMVSDSYDEQRCRYEPLPQLRLMYPPNVDGCWMVDAVMPDEA